MTALRPAANARLWAAIGLMFIVALFSAAPAVLADSSTVHADHHVSSFGELDHLATVDHEHISSSGIHTGPDVFTDAMRQRMRVTVTVSALILTVGVLWRLSPEHAPRVGRAPPRAGLVSSAGRDCLARLCISRR